MGTNCSEDIPDKHSANRLKRWHKSILVIALVIGGLSLIVFGALAVIIQGTDTDSEIGDALILFAFLGCLLFAFLGVLLVGIGVIAWKRPDIGGVLSLIISFLLIYLTSPDIYPVSIFSIIAGVFAVVGVINIAVYQKRRNNSNLSASSARDTKSDFSIDEEL